MQHPARSPTTETVFERPGQDPPGVVVDYGMQVGSRAIEQSDDRDVQVKEFVGSTCSDSDLRFGRIDAIPETPPPGFPGQDIPRRGRRKDLPDSLRMKRQRSERHVSVIAALDHFLHHSDFVRSQASGHRARAAGLIVQIAPNPARHQL